MTQFKKVPLGAVKPLGWLKDQLIIQARGLTGHLEEEWHELKDNGWKGGSGESWERGPYYLDGLIPLAYILGDKKLIKQSQVWIEYILNSQKKDGSFGPDNLVTVNSDLNKDKDWWHYMLVMKVLIQYHDATEDQRVVPFMTSFFRYLYANIMKHPLEGWAKARGTELLLSLSWLRTKSNPQFLEPLTQIIVRQSTQWQQVFTEFPFTRPIENWHWDSHVVNVAMGIKYSGVIKEATGGGSKESVLKAIDDLMTYHGQAHGMFSGDEWLAGTDPSRGLELCAVVEYMYSLEELTRIYGDGYFSDLLEKVAFNALPGGISYDWHSHQYDQQVNQVICNHAERPWSNRADANLFGLEPNFGCCTANMHQGWPKFVAHAVMQSDKGYVVNTYAPSQTILDDFEMTITSDYPFRNTIKIEVSSDEECQLKLLKPSWCSVYQITVDGRSFDVKEEDNYICLSQKWSKNLIEIELDMKVKQVYRGSTTSIERGPLVFVLPIKEDWRQLVKRNRFHDYELSPMSRWQYGINYESSLDVSYGDLQKQVFSGAPVVVNVQAHFLPDWQMKNNSAEAPRYHYQVASDQETLQLIPYACRKLRIGAFPILNRG